MEIPVNPLLHQLSYLQSVPGSSPELLLQMNKKMNTALPVEMLEMVFKLLTPEDRMTAMQVCRYWKTVCEHSSFWIWSTLTINKRTLTSIQEMVACRRFQDLRSLRIFDPIDLTEELFLKFHKWTKLERLEVQVSSVTRFTEQLKKIIDLNSLEKLNLSKVHITVRGCSLIGRLDKQ